MWEEMKEKEGLMRVRGRYFWAGVHRREKRERWWIEHEKIMRNEILFNKMSSLRQWSGEHRCHFHRDCCYRWISPTKTSIPRVQRFLDFAAIERQALKTRLWKRTECQLRWGCFLALRWRLNRKRSARISSDQECSLWIFLISADVQIAEDKMPLWL